MVLAVVVAVVAVFAITNVVTIVGSKGSIVTAEKAGIGNADAIVVLGASVLPDGTPSGILADRLDDGIALYFAGVAPKIIMSGDNGTASYNEVKAMKQYAIAQGVPGRLLRSRGFLHVREHVSGKVRVRVRAHRGGHADVSPVSRAVVREKPGDAS